MLNNSKSSSATSAGGGSYNPPRKPFPVSYSGGKCPGNGCNQPSLVPSDRGYVCITCGHKVPIS